MLRTKAWLVDGFILKELSSISGEKLRVQDTEVEGRVPRCERIGPHPLIKTPETGLSHTLKALRKSFRVGHLV